MIWKVFVILRLQACRWQLQQLMQIIVGLL